MLVAWWVREERGNLTVRKATVKALKLATYTTPTPVAIAILDHC